MEHEFEKRSVYRFGGKGNDWCFVYLPEGYDPNRARPYPFVICNHGNGWTMDGSAKTANWTKRTMYVPMDDPDYLAAPMQYNGTNDAALWYSNPTVEAFLTAGYVVCGCQNHGDCLYGNRDCRDACVAFYHHMVENYHVTAQCAMIGASNGAMTTLNASAVLGEKVRAIILQYPLTCLKNQYYGYPDHQTAIRKAHNISDEAISEADFIKATDGFDTMYTNMEDGVKKGYFPPAMILWSSTDAVTKGSINALPLYEMLQRSGKTVKIWQVDTDGKIRGHGDYAHFAPEEYVAWIEEHFWNHSFHKNRHPYASYY